MNSKRYVGMLGRVMFGQRNGVFRVASDRFQQDGAPIHTADTVLKYLGSKTSGRVISRRNEIIIGCLEPF